MVAFEVKLGGISGQAMRGNLTLNSDGLKWESEKAGERTVDVKAQDVEGMEWGRTGKSFQLRVAQSDGSVVRCAPVPQCSAGRAGEVSCAAVH